MEIKFFLVQLIKGFILPPGLFLVILSLVLWAFLQNRKILGLALLAGTIAGIFILSLSITSHLLMSLVEFYKPLSTAQIQTSRAQAIVILSGGRVRNAPEYGGQTLGTGTLQRIRYGARLQRLSQLPILVTGGGHESEGPSMGQLMATALNEDYDIQARWLETKSRDTKENAEFSAAILKQENVEHIYLVTNAWHLTRAVPIFEKYGLKVTPAPTGFEAYTFEGAWVYDFIPSAKALWRSRDALHELLGQIYYALRY